MRPMRFSSKRPGWLAVAFALILAAGALRAQAGEMFVPLASESALSDVDGVFPSDSAPVQGRDWTNVGSLQHADGTLQQLEAGLEPPNESATENRLISLLTPDAYEAEPFLDYRDCPWTWQLLPDGLIYKSYLAGEKEPRFASAWLYEKDRGVVWDVALGGRVGIFRYGTPGTFRPRGWQLDFEGAVFPRVDPDEHHDLEASDFRVGIPLTWSRGSIAIKAGYFHISSHVGDEFLIRTGYQRINYVRDSLVLGIAHYPSNDTRVYFEIGYAPGVSGGAEPLEFQFGAEYSPVWEVACGGAPFAAINGHLREEVDFGGSVNFMTGWQWRGPESNRLLRIGFQFFDGKSYYYEFFNTHEQLTGIGIWLDY
jgi:hypothetical protein